MSTIADLETDLVVVVEALATSPNRAVSDHNDTQGEVLTPDQWYYRLRLTVLEETPVSSNQNASVVQMQLDLLVKMAAAPPNPRSEKSYSAAIGVDQEALVKPTFYKALASVLEVPTDTVPQVVESVERNGNVLLYQVAANLILQP